ncbi:hypothetical protein OSB04_un001607 [Centaurea solstitialis]|uniref:DUF4283 domain-containing protein n=1 Tax=Centaurea solstitialis TaxID=347529 RepID=A0AA38W1K5_9ASTR|nr:hypothetical protein OSB04_un001607 [Centaurea solstitialis]
MVTPIVDSEVDNKHVLDLDLRSEVAKEESKFGDELLENLDSTEDSISGADEVSEDSHEGVNMESPISSAISKDVPQELSNLVNPKRNGKKIEAISKSMDDLSSGKSESLSDKVVEVPAISVINKSTSINIAKILKQVQDPNDVIMVKKENEIRNCETGQLMQGADESCVSTQLAQGNSSCHSNGAQQDLGEYMKDSEQYLKNVINMFNQPDKGSLKSVGGGSNSVKGGNVLLEKAFSKIASDIFFWSSVIDQKVGKAGQGRNGDGADMVMEEVGGVQGINLGKSIIDGDTKEMKKGEGNNSGQMLSKEGEDEVMGEGDSVILVKKKQGVMEDKAKNAWKGVTLADKIKGNTESKIILKFKEPIVLEDGRKVVRFSKEVIQEGAKLNSMQLIGHFVGVSMPFLLVSNLLMRLWKKYGLIDVASNYAGYFILKFNNEEGMFFVLENGPWMLNNVPFFVRKWEVGCVLGKPELKKLPMWVNLYGVPLEIWNVQGLSELASGIGVPLALDRATEERCLKQAGRAGFARVLIEVAADRSIPDSISGLIPLLDGRILVRAEYKWKPSRCEHCKVFGHTFAKCEVRVLTDEEKSEKLKKESQFRPAGGCDDGFQEVGKRNRLVTSQVRQVGAKNWVNQKFGQQKQGNNLGAAEKNQFGIRFGQKDGQGLKSRQPGNGERFWQVKKQVGQQQDGNGANINRVFEVGQTSGVKKHDSEQNLGVQEGSGSKKGLQQLERGVNVRKNVKSGVDVGSRQVGNINGRRVVVKGSDGISRGVVDSRVVQNEIPLSNSFEALSKNDNLAGDVMIEENEGGRVEEWFEEGVGVGVDGSLNDHMWELQRKVVNYYLEQGLNPPLEVLEAWNERQIVYFKAVQNGEMVFEKSDAPDFMKPVKNVELKGLGGSSST